LFAAGLKRGVDRGHGANEADRLAQSAGKASEWRHDGKRFEHDALVRLEDDDHDKLLHLCRIGDTNKNDIIRQCIRHVYDAEMAEMRKRGGAA
jgi:hypothetical protein